MTLKLYNTLSRKKEEFKPIHAPNVGMYACGPTVYNYAHIGNLRTYIFNDVLRRTLIKNSFKLKEVMNITDVDDKTIRISLSLKFMAVHTWYLFFLIGQCICNGKNIPVKKC